jgi:hypothetical protein
MVERCERSSRQAPEPSGGWLCQRAGAPPRRSGPLPVSARATAGPLAAIPALAPALGDVRQQRKLARALDCARDLALMAAARSRDPPRSDLAALGDEAA